MTRYDIKNKKLYIIIMMTIFDWVLAEHKELYVVFVDYSVTFDSVRHKFLDSTVRLSERGHLRRLGQYTERHAL